MLAYGLREEKTAVSLLLHLIGPEGFGKSSFCQLLAGSSLTTPNLERYTDKVALNQFIGSASHGQHTLYNIAKGKTVTEFADRSFAGLGETLSQAVKTLIDTTFLTWRYMHPLLGAICIVMISISYPGERSRSRLPIRRRC
jgi:hypothetical protein